MLEILEKIVAGKGEMEDLERLEELAEMRKQKLKEERSVQLNLFDMMKELGRQLFSTAGGKSVEELVSSDFKEFHIGEQNLGVGQVTCLDSMEMLERKEEFLAVMRRLQEERHYNMVILMLTDVLLEGTQLLYVGSDEAIRNAFSAEPKDNALFLPGVMSRKKQVIPMLSALWG